MVIKRNPVGTLEEASPFGHTSETVVVGDHGPITLAGPRHTTNSFIRLVVAALIRLDADMAQETELKNILKLKVVKANDGGLRLVGDTEHDDDVSVLRL